MQNTITILGCRGSIPRSGKKYVRYGGATNSILVSLAGEEIVLDAGTGILDLPEHTEKNVISLILSHGHVDHIMGFPMCGMVFSPKNHFDIYGIDINDASVKEQLECLMMNPLWPVGPEGLACDIAYHQLEPEFKIGNVTVQTIRGNHPAGSAVIKLIGGGKTVVYATDCTLEQEDFYRQLKDFAAGCDLLLVDGQYTDAEFPARATFGHSSMESAARFGRDCGAKETVIIHHDPQRVDDALDQFVDVITEINDNCSFGFDGEVIEL